MNAMVAVPPKARAGEPVWGLAQLFPAQGSWTVEQYLNFDRAGNLPIEFSDGYVEVLPMPSWQHQMIVMFLAEALRAFIRPTGLGQASVAPLPVQLKVKQWREPDVVFLFSKNLPTGKYPERADLVMEVVSEDARSRERDYDEKRGDYARAGVSEYWIVDPQDRKITVLKLVGDQYSEQDVYVPGEQARSALLPGFSVDVAKALRGE